MFASSRSRPEYARAAVSPVSPEGGRCRGWLGEVKVLWCALCLLTCVMAIGSASLYSQAFSSGDKQGDEIREWEGGPSAAGTGGGRVPSTAEGGAQSDADSEHQFQGGGHGSSDSWDMTRERGTDAAEGEEDPVEESMETAVEGEGGDNEFSDEWVHSDSVEASDSDSVEASDSTTEDVDEIDSDFDDASMGRSSGRSHPPAQDKTPPLVFIHIPKNAGGSIEDACSCDRAEDEAKCEHLPRFHLISRTVRTEGLELPGNWPMEVASDDRLCKSYGHMFPQYDALQLEVSRLHPSFCVVRHPLTRAVSEYEFKHRHDPGGANNVEEMNLHLRNAARYRIEHGECSPENKSSCNADCHWASQYLYLWDLRSGEPTCDHVLFYENLDEEFEELMKFYGVSGRCSLQPKGEGDSKGTHTFAGTHLGAEDLEDETYLLLLEAYADDMAIFGYAPNDLHAAPEFRPPLTMPPEYRAQES